MASIAMFLTVEQVYMWPVLLCRTPSQYVCSIIRIQTHNLHVIQDIPVTAALRFAGCVYELLDAELSAFLSRDNCEK